MIWHVTPLFGIKAVTFVDVDGEDEPDVVVILEVQGGAQMKVHMRPTEWRWLGIELHKKKVEEDQRMGIADTP